MYVDGLINELNKIDDKTDKVLHICDFIRVLEYCIKDYGERPGGEASMYRSLILRINAKTKDELETSLVIAKTLLEEYVKK